MAQDQNDKVRKLPHRSAPGPDFNQEGREEQAAWQKHRERQRMPLAPRGSSEVRRTDKDRAVEPSVKTEPRAL